MFDKELLKLADCKVIKTKEGERCGLLIDPDPVIKADNDGTLAHEICHLLAGEKDYIIYNEAIWERENDKIFTYILNTLFDWAHEFWYGKSSKIVWKYLTKMHDNKETDKYTVGIAIIDNITNLYLKRNIDPKYVGITCTEDLVGYADQICEALKKSTT